MFWGRRIHYRGISPTGTSAFGISFSQQGLARWLGRDTEATDIILQREQTAGEYISAKSWDALVFAVPVAELHGMISDISQFKGDGTLDYHGVTRLSGRVAADLRHVAFQYSRTMTECLAGNVSRYALATIAGQLKKYFVHQVVMAAERDLEPPAMRSRDLGPVIPGPP